MITVNITAKLSLGPKLFRVYADENSIEQIPYSLLLNVMRLASNITFVLWRLNRESLSFKSVSGRAQPTQSINHYCAYSDTINTLAHQ